MSVSRCRERLTHTVLGLFVFFFPRTVVPNISHIFTLLSSEHRADHHTSARAHTWSVFILCVLRAIRFWASLRVNSPDGRLSPARTSVLGQAGDGMATGKQVLTPRPGKITKSTDRCLVRFADAPLHRTFEATGAWYSGYKVIKHYAHGARLWKSYCDISTTHTKRSAFGCT